MKSSMISFFEYLMESVKRLQTSVYSLKRSKSSESTPYSNIAISFLLKE